MKGTGKWKIRTHLIIRASGLKTLMRNVGQRNHSSIAQQSMWDRNIKGKVLDIVVRHIRKK